MSVSGQLSVFVPRIKRGARGFKRGAPIFSFHKLDIIHSYKLFITSQKQQGSAQGNNIP